MTGVSWTRMWLESRLFLRQIWRRYYEDRLAIIAAAITYYLLLSMIPLLLLAVSVASFFISPHQAEARLAHLAATLAPELIRVLRTEVLSVVYHRGVLTGIALLLSFWVGSQVFVVLETAINQVWHNTRVRPWWESRGLALLLVVLVGLLIALATTLTYLIHVLGRLEIPLWGHPVRSIPFFITALVSVVIPILLVFAIFTTLYRILPTRAVTVRSVLPGAVFAGVLWTVFLRLFGWYTTHIANYSVLYGSLGGLVLLMLWFNYGATVFLLGAEINVVYHLRLLRAGDAAERRVEAARETRHGADGVTHPSDHRLAAAKHKRENRYMR